MSMVWLNNEFYELNEFKPKKFKNHGSISID